jgi:DNA invertase Pin-like site-specific DNA recombinase
VIVERADRFGRNDTQALRAIDELHEFGVAVRFANTPDLDPMDPDDRALVALSFTLARRESLTSPYCLAELEEARRLRKHILPVKLRRGRAAQLAGFAPLNLL